MANEEIELNGVTYVRKDSVAQAKPIVISLDVAKGKDKCYEVTYCIRNKDKIIKVDTISLKEAK